MMRFLPKSAMLAVVALAIAVATPARAQTTINPNTDGEPSLVVNTAEGTSVLNTLYGAGNYSRVSDSSDNIWSVAPTATLNASVKFAGDTSNFGVFQNPNTLAFTPLAGVSGSGYGATFVSIGSPYANVSGGILTVSGPGGPNPPTPLSSPLALGINNTTTGNFFSSNMAVNTVDSGGPGVNPMDHMVTFFVTNSNGTVKGFTGYVVAFEDLTFAQGSDRDFNDLVVQIDSGLTPAVPEPSTFAIAGLGALGLIGYGLRRRKGA